MASSAIRSKRCRPPLLTLPDMDREVRGVGPVGGRGQQAAVLDRDFQVKGEATAQILIWNHGTRGRTRLWSQLSQGSNHLVPRLFSTGNYGILATWAGACTSRDNREKPGFAKTRFQASPHQPTMVARLSPLFQVHIENEVTLVYI